MFTNQENVMFTDEESELLHPEVVLTEGVWEFDICFDPPENREMELIEIPIITSVSSGWGADGADVYTEVRITSFVLRPFSATMKTDDGSFAPDLLPRREDRLLVVMTDGTTVELDSESGAPGEQQFRVSAPIILDKVDHVLLPDGTKLTIP